MAIALAEAGANIIGVSASLESSGSVVETAVRDLGKNFYPYQCDFRDRAALYAFLSTIKKNHPLPDILINNAGTIERSPAQEHTDKIWDEIIEVNQTSPFILSREIGKEMVQRGSGKIIFTASVLSYQAGITVPSYTASKGAIGQITKALANEWAEKGVNVNAIAPGYIATDNTAALRKDQNRATAILDRIPAKRWGKPEDLAGAVVFLSSAASNYVHGSLLAVDGGWLGR